MAKINIQGHFIYYALKSAKNGAVQAKQLPVHILYLFNHPVRAYNFSASMQFHEQSRRSEEEGWTKRRKKIERKKK